MSQIEACPYWALLVDVPRNAHFTKLELAWVGNIISKKNIFLVLGGRTLENQVLTLDLRSSNVFNIMKSESIWNSHSFSGDLLLTLRQARKPVLKAAANASPWAPKEIVYICLAGMSLGTYLGNKSPFLIFLVSQHFFPIAAVFLTHLFSTLRSFEASKTIQGFVLNSLHYMAFGQKKTGLSEAWPKPPQPRPPMLEGTKHAASMWEHC